MHGPDPEDVPGDHHPRDPTSMPHGMLRRASTTDIGLGTNAAALTTARLGDTSTVSSMKIPTFRSSGAKIATADHQKT